MNYDESIIYLYSRGLFSIKLGLENITNLMTKLGNPQKEFKSIHVAGTNGKGSVCAFLASILKEQGYKVGIYTSPHLVDFRERIMVDGKKISKEDVVSFVEKVKPLVDTHTYFEIVTAMAFNYFKEQKVDFAIIEVGMGGRLDATNILIPELCVITDISKEHEKHLGDTIEKIAYEKAGIIKENVEVITNENNGGLKVIRKACDEKNCVLHLAKPVKKESGLRGEFQYENLGIALKAVELLRNKNYKVDEKSIDEGIKKVRWPGRLDFVSDNLLFDCAHNPDGAKTLVDEIKKMDYDRIYLVLGIMKDKNMKDMCKHFETIGDEIILTKAKISRAADPEEIKRFVSKDVKIIRNIKDALDYCKNKAKEKDLIILTGSIYTVGEGFEAIGRDPFEGVN